MELQIAHPVAAAGGKVHQLARGAGHPVGAERVIKGQHRVVIGDIERAIAPGEAGGRIKALLQQHHALVGDAVRIGIAQQHDLIGRSPRRSRLGEEVSRHPGLDPRYDPGGRGSGLGRAGQAGEDIAIGQGIERARVIEPLRKARDREPLGGLGRLALGPANRLGHRDRGEALLLRLGERRIGADHRLDRQLGGLPAREEKQPGPGKQSQHGKRDCDLAKNAHASCDKDRALLRQWKN